MTITFSGWLSHTILLSPQIHIAVRNPKRISSLGLASFAFARHYLRNLVWFLFLALLRCFSSGGSPPYAMNSRMDTWTTSCGLLHSDICGSKLAYSSPQLIAVNHVLHRLPMPRHSLYALLRFTICFLVTFAFSYDFPTFAVFHPTWFLMSFLYLLVVSSFSSCFLSILFSSCFFVLCSLSRTDIKR